MANSSTRRVIAVLKGGLGNQMFQYAAARRLAVRNEAELVLDTRTGFERDRIFNRTFELRALPVVARTARGYERLPVYWELLLTRLSRSRRASVTSRPWGDWIHELASEFIPDVIHHRLRRRATWVDGYWQSERYFSDIADLIRTELMPPSPEDEASLRIARELCRPNAVAVGVRLFEDVPGRTKDCVGGLTPFQFYFDAARIAASRIDSPMFFLFCTARRPLHALASLPGEVRYVTPDDGVMGTASVLWLFAQCRHHIISNSSFYWWGAWLAESTNTPSLKIASPYFTNTTPVPQRWTTLSRN